MNTRLTFFIFILFLITVACSSGQNKDAAADDEDLNFGDEQETGVVGSWKNKSIDVDLHTYNNSDTSFHVAVNEDNWKIKMNINPIITEINEDGTFLTNYRDTLNHVFHQNKGTWYIDGDSLFLIDEKGIKYPYKVRINGDILKMSTNVDYDEDGVKDDYYLGEYIKIDNESNK